MFNRRRPLIAIILMMIILAGCAGQKRSQIDNLYREGQYDQGIQAAEENLRKVRAAKGDNNLETAANMNLLAKGYHSMGDFAKAEPLFKKALAIRERNLGPNDLQVAVSLDNLAGLYADMGDFAKAEPLYKRALKIREQNLADDHPDVAVSLNNLATLYYYLGRHRPGHSAVRTVHQDFGGKVGRQQPRSGHQPGQPGRDVRLHRPVRRSGAIVQKGVENQKKHAAGRSSGSGGQSEQHGVVLSGKKGLCPSRVLFHPGFGHHQKSRGDRTIQG